MSYRFQCRTCGEWHDGIPDLAFSAPAQYLSLTDKERKSAAKKSDDLCSINDKDFFVRGVIEVPIMGHNDTFCFGVWVSLAKAHFGRYVELFDSKDPSGSGPYPAKLCNRIAGYPDTFGLKTKLSLRPAPARPQVIVEKASHPIAVQQRDGIAIADVHALLERASHA